MGKKSLGMGLGSLLDDVGAMYENGFSNELTSNTDIVKDIDLIDISPNPYQPRKTFKSSSIEELALSIKNHGLLQPIVLVEADELCKKALEAQEKIEKTSKYFLIAGERRLRAIKYLGQNSIRAIIANIDSAKTRELALIENIQREDLNPIELALAYKEIIQAKKITQDELASSIQKSRASVANTLRLLSLEPQTQQMIIEGKLSAGHAKIIAGQKQDEQTLLNSIIGQKLNVRECEKLAKKLKTQKDAKIEYLDEELLKKLKDNNIDFKLVKNKLSFDLNRENTINFIKSAIKTL